MATNKQPIFPPHVQPAAPYSPGVLAGDVLYVSGQTSRNADGGLAATTEEHVRTCLGNIQRIVATAGLQMTDVRRTQVYLTNPEQELPLRHVWREVFPENPPDIELIIAPRLPTDMPVEINATAVRGHLPLPQQGIVTLRAVGDAHETAAQAATRLIARLDDELQRQGAHLTDIVEARLTMRNLDEFHTMNEAYAAAFGTHRPARTTVQANQEEALRITVYAII